MGSLGVQHYWATSLSLFIFMHWRRKWQPTPVFLPGESQGRGSLVGYSPWGCRVRHNWVWAREVIIIMITILRYLQWTLFTKCTIPRLAQGKCSIAGAHPTAAAAAAAVAKSLQCPALCDPIDGSPPGCPWDPPGKNTGVGCHFLLQCMKVKSESEVT